DTVAITVTPVADAPTLMVTSPVSGTESTPIPLTITAALTDTDGSETLAIEITGYPTGTTFSAGVNNGTSVKLTPLQLAGLTITVPDAANGTTLNLLVTATSTETANGSTASTSAPLVVNVSNANPTATLSNSGPVKEGSTATVTFTNQADVSPADVAAG